MLLSNPPAFRSLNCKAHVKYFLHQLTFFLGPFDAVPEIDGAGTRNSQAAGFIHRAVNRFNSLVVFIVQRVHHPQNRAQLTDDLLIAGSQLAEGQVLLARVRFAMVTGDVRDQIQVQFVE